MNTETNTENTVPTSKLECSKNFPYTFGDLVKTGFALTLGGMIAFGLAAGFLNALFS